MRSISMYRAAFALASFCCTASPAIVWAETATVLRVIDGDTCLLDDGRMVRYLGIDAPEKGDPHSNEATLANNRLVGGKQIRIEEHGLRKDRNGRLLAYVFVGDVFVNEKLVRQGHAHVRRPLAARFRQGLLKAQADARAKGQGIWAKVASARISISRVHADAEGRDRDNLNDEYIIIENKGDTAIDFAGWTVSDEANHRYLCPRFILPAKGKVTLRTGLGKNTADELFWGNRGPIWNNDGDTILIRDADGHLVWSYVY
ncbi:lamin tail domain-containing protein [PVC group bacterium]|nr:lamin tail domain-containing protein [PVC group bacterium]